MEKIGGINVSLIEKKCLQKTLLDYGSGDGMYSVFFLKRGFNVISVDINPDSEINILNQLSEEEKKRFKFYCLDAERDAFPEELLQVDCILCREVLEHIKGYKSLINNFHKSLNKDGILVVSVPNSITEKYFSFWDPNWLAKCQHVNVFTQKYLINFFERNRFKIIMKSSHSFRRTIFWSLAAPFRIKHDMGKALSHKRLVKFANFVSNCVCYFKPIETFGNYIIPKSRIFYLKKYDEIKF